MHFQMERGRSICNCSGELVSISSDAQQPSGHPYLHARARAPFRIKPEAAGEVGLPRGCGRHAVRESIPAWSGIEVDSKSARVRGGHPATRGRVRRSTIRGRFAAGMFSTGPDLSCRSTACGRRGGGVSADGHRNRAARRTHQNRQLFAAA